MSFFSSRLFAALELCLASLFWMLAVWGGGFPTGLYGQATGVVLLLLLIVSSLVIRRPGWKASGFSIEHFWPAFFQAVFILAIVLGVATFIIYKLGYSFHPVTSNRVFKTILRALFQEAVFLGIFFPRWQLLLGGPWRACFVNAMVFSLIHLPDPFFVFLTMTAGILFGALFIRFRNIFIVGLIHGILSLFVFSTLRHEGALSTMKIGPPQLISFSHMIIAEAKPGDRVGLGSHELVQEQLGLRLPYKIEKVSGHFDEDNEEMNRALLSSFLSDSQRVFCILIDKDFERYFASDKRARLFVLSEKQIWKRKIRINGEFITALFEQKPLILRAFQDRVLLVSNQSEN